MAVDLMEMIKGAVSQQVMGKLGGMLGIEEKKQSSIFESVAGAILGGLMKKASAPGGAKEVYEAAQNQDNSILDKLGDLLGGGQQTEELQKSGGGILDMVLGGNQTGMIDAIAKALGLDKGMIGKLLTMLAPIVLAVIGRHLQSKALDAVGMGSLLNDQQKTLGKYMPASLTSNLGLGDMLGSTSQAASNVGKTASNAANQTAAQGGGVMKMLIPLVILGLLGFALWKFLGPGAPAPVTPKVDISKIETPKVEMPGLDFSNFDLSSMGKTGTALKTGFTDITKGFNGLKDETSAKGLVDTISGFSGKLEGLGLGDLTGPAKTATSGLISKFIETLKQLVADKVPDSLKGIVQPAVDGLLEKLKSYAG